MYSPETTKYLIHLTLEAGGVVEKPDVVGAIFGQTEGLLGEELDLRDLQRSGRVGRIDVQISSKKGETKGTIQISSSLDKAETALLAASLETIDRVGPCSASVSVEGIEDIRITKRRKIAERAKELLLESFDEGTIKSYDLLDEVRETIRVEKLVYLEDGKVPAGPNVIDSDAILIVEGRADVVNLLKCGIKNAVAVDGTSVPGIIIDLSEKKTATAFLDGDRGGELILRELLQVADIDYVAYCHPGRSVEGMTRKEISKALRNKVPVDVAVNRHHEELSAEQQSKPPATASDAVTDHPPERSPEVPEPMPTTLKEHISGIKGTNLVRFLSPDFTVLRESASEEIVPILSDLNGDVAGLVIDGVIDQRVLDLMADKAIGFVAARDFRSISKRPLSVKLIMIP